MRRLPGQLRGAFTALAIVSLFVPVSAAAATRTAAASVDAASKAKGAAVAKDKSNDSEATSAASSGNAHKKGRPPKSPSATLPTGEAQAEVDEDARRAIAGGDPSPSSELPEDPELRALREAEEALFPKPVEGLVPGWTWTLPGQGDAATTLGLGATGTPQASALPAWVGSLVMPDFPVRLEPRVIRYLEFYRDSKQGRAIAEVWARKSGRFVPVLQDMFESAGLPRDMVWLSLVESGHNPTIRSPVGAAGLWQFMAATARNYGLTVDRWVDERLDPRRSTEAAILLLSDLHRRFGNWELAMAAYNMGHGALGRSIRKYNTNDFWQLSSYEGGLPWETSLYVPKIMALAIVMNNRAAFGLEEIVPDPVVQFDVVLANSGTPLTELARAAGVSREALGGLNPQLLADRIPPQPPGREPRAWPLYVPMGQGRVTATRLLRRQSEQPDCEPWVLRRGETLESLAAERGTTESKLRSLNRVASDEVLTAGTVVLLPKGSATTVTSEAPVVAVSARQLEAPERVRILYQTAPGDTLENVSSALGITRDELLLSNNLDVTARLQPGMMLQAFVPPSTDLRRVRWIPAESARLLATGSSEFIDYHEGLAGRRRKVVAARAGDTVAAVGKRFGLSAGSMERINRRSRADLLAEGEPLIVYVDEEPPAEVLPDTPAPLSAPLPPHPEVLPGATATLEEGPAPTTRVESPPASGG